MVMVLYAKIDREGYIDGFSEIQDEIYNTEFEIQE